MVANEAILSKKEICKAMDSHPFARKKAKGWGTEIDSLIWISVPCF
jgi:hypothetical protein